MTIFVAKRRDRSRNIMAQRDKEVSFLVPLVNQYVCRLYASAASEPGTTERRVICGLHNRYRGSLVPVDVVVDEPPTFRIEPGERPEVRSRQRITCSAVCDSSVEKLGGNRANSSIGADKCRSCFSQGQQEHHAAAAT